MRRQLGMVIALLVTLVACGEPDLREKFRKVREYREIVRTLEEPITVTQADVFADLGGSRAFTIVDARGRELSFCVQGVMARDTSGLGAGHLFGIGFMHIGDHNWVWDNAVPVGPDSEFEDELLDLMRKWVDDRFPDWTDSSVVRYVRRRENGALNDTAAAAGFRSAIRLVERRKAVLQSVRYPGW